MVWKVKGTDERTGQVRTVKVTGATREEAAARARVTGMLISSCVPVRFWGKLLSVVAAGVSGGILLATGAVRALFARVRQPPRQELDVSEDVAAASDQ